MVRPHQFTPAGDSGLYVRFGNAVDPAIHADVMTALAALDGARPTGVTDVVPGYTALLVIHDPARIGAAQVRAWAEDRLQRAGRGPDVTPAVAPPRRREIPVLYDPRVAPDLLPLAAEKGLTPAALIALHAGADYRCYMLGFRPGFPFLGGLPPQLSTPRLATPRLSVPAGSVAIGGQQTGVYPTAGPGGWRIIGRTPLRLFAPERDDPFFVAAGDLVTFVAIDERRFDELAGQESSSG